MANPKMPHEKQKNINQKIDEYVKSERRKIIAALALASPAAVVLIATSTFFAAPNLGHKSTETGVVNRMTGLPSDDGDILYLLVTLEDGEKVRVRIPNSSLYRKDERVRLEKQMPLLFGRPVYRFRGYLTPPEK